MKLLKNTLMGRSIAQLSHKKIRAQSDEVSFVTLSQAPAPTLQLQFEMGRVNSLSEFGQVALNLDSSSSLSFDDQTWHRVAEYKPAGINFTDYWTSTASIYVEPQMPNMICVEVRNLKLTSITNDSDFHIYDKEQFVMMNLNIQSLEKHDVLLSLLRLYKYNSNWIGSHIKLLLTQLRDLNLDFPELKAIEKSLGDALRKAAR